MREMWRGWMKLTTKMCVEGKSCRDIKHKRTHTHTIGMAIEKKNISNFELSTVTNFQVKQIVRQSRIWPERIVCAAARMSLYNHIHTGHNQVRQNVKDQIFELKLMELAIQNTEEKARDPSFGIDGPAPRKPERKKTTNIHYAAAGFLLQCKNGRSSRSYFFLYTMAFVLIQLKRKRLWSFFCTRCGLIKPLPVVLID